MEKSPIELKILPFPSKGNEQAEMLRDFADECERGDVVDVAIVAAKKDEIVSAASFSDRLSFLGSLELIKWKMMSGE